MNTGSDRGTGTTLIKHIKKRDGVVMLELVLVISILTVIFLATFTFSFLYDDYCAIQKVAAQGAREASITGDVNWARIKALQSAWLWGLDPGRTTLEFNTGSGDVTCTVQYAARPFHKTFPRLLEGNSLQDFHLQTSARYVWSDTR